VDTSRFETYPPGEFLPGTQIEILNPQVEVGRIRFCLFDFDGTLSLIREGWQDVMVPMLVDHLVALQTGDDRAELEQVVTEFVTRLTGKQTIYQMMALADEITKRGGQPEDPLVYKRQYLDLLWKRIAHRVAGLKSGANDPEEMLVPGSREFLEGLAAAGTTNYLASGTDHEYVVDEAQALRVDRYFGQHIYGALDNFQDFSKKMVIERILRENDLHGPELCAFGDGYVEIEDAKLAGGVAVGLATNEETRTGLNDWKRNRLIQAGADIIVPDFREAGKLLEFLGLAY
jgi:phosphoglycolate phosphatase